MSNETRLPRAPNSIRIRINRGTASRAQGGDDEQVVFGLKRRVSGTAQALCCQSPATSGQIRRTHHPGRTRVPAVTGTLVASLSPTPNSFVVIGDRSTSELHDSLSGSEADVPSHQAAAYQAVAHMSNISSSSFPPSLSCCDSE